MKNSFFIWVRVGSLELCLGVIDLTSVKIIPSRHIIELLEGALMPQLHNLQHPIFRKLGVFARREGPLRDEVLIEVQGVLCTSNRPNGLQNRGVLNHHPPQLKLWGLFSKHIQASHLQLLRGDAAGDTPQGLNGHLGVGESPIDGVLRRLQCRQRVPVFHQLRLMPFGKTQDQLHSVIGTREIPSALHGLGPLCDKSLQIDGRELTGRRGAVQLDMNFPQ